MKKAPSRSKNTITVSPISQPEVLQRQTLTPLAILGPFITPTVLSRVTELLNLNDEETVALIVARIVNPDFTMEQQQEAKLRGMKAETLRGRKQQGEFSGGFWNPVKGV